MILATLAQCCKTLKGSLTRLGKGKSETKMR
jgi:hypothetical protein